MGPSSLWDQVDVVSMQQQDNEALRIVNGFYEEKSDGPNVFAEAISCYIDCEHTGTWESSKSGSMIWRQRVRSEGAYSLNMAFSEFYLPSSAQLFISDKNQEIIIGPLTSADNDEHGEWWSPVFPSDEVLIQVHVAPKQASELRLVVEQLNHDFTGLGRVLSGSCNLDVICSEVDGFDIVERFRDAINAVGLVTINGTSNCTGSLVNNARNDCTPYFLTAEHCGIRTNNDQSIVVYWNFQNTRCRQPSSADSGGPGNGRLTEFNSGSTLRARFDRSDFTLVEFDDDVDPLTNPFYLGWDRITESVDTAVCIHHPQGDEKRISFDFGSLTFGIDRYFVRVSNWEVGTTEPGSSGSPLLTKDQLLVGTLTGGDAACGNRFEDDYGMFKEGWEGGGSSVTRMRDWLDPDNTGVESIPGRYCMDVANLSQTSISICRSTNPSQTIQITAEVGYQQGGILSVVDPVPGVEITFSDQEITTDETIDITLSIDNQFEGNSGQATIRVENDLGPIDFNIGLEVFDGVPSAAELVQPQDQAESLDFFVDFAWNTDGPTSRLELATLPDFSGSILAFDDLTENSMRVTDLETSTTYFWRVRSSNACGDSEYSSVRSFRTGTIVCETFFSSDTPIRIGLVPETISSVVSIQTDGVISDINLRDLSIRHTWISDLTVSLISPSGTEVLLFDTPCSDEDDIQASFDDESSLINLDCPLTTNRTFRPAGELSAFNGEDPSGDWILQVIDGVAEDGGALDSWTLEICTNKSNRKFISIDPSFIEVCEKDESPLSFTLDLEGDWISPSDVVLSTGSGQVVPVVVSPDPINDAREISLVIENQSLLMGLDEIEVTITDQGNMLTETISILRLGDGIAPELLDPPNNNIDEGLSPTLSWASDNAEMTGYTVQISLDDQFSQIVFDETLNDLEIVVQPSLDPQTIYFWRVVSIGECQDFESETFSFETGLGTATIDPDLVNISIYPSPADNFIILDISNAISASSFDIIDISGRVVQPNTPLTTEVSRLDASGFAEGIYLMRIISERGIYTTRFVIAR